MGDPINIELEPKRVKIRNVFACGSLSTAFGQPDDTKYNPCDRRFRFCIFAPHFSNLKSLSEANQLWSVSN